MPDLAKLKELAALKDSGVLNEEEFAAEKGKVLSGEEYTLIKPTRDSVCGVRLRSYEEEAGVQILALEPGGLAASSGLKV